MQNYELTVANNGAESVPYNTPEYPLYAGKGWLHYFRDMGVVNHWHWDFEFAYVISGRMSYSVNQSTVTLLEGEGIFVNSGQIHRNFSSDGADGEYRCILIHPSVLQTAFQHALQQLNDLCGNSRLPYVVLRPDVPWQKDLIGDINGIYDGILTDIHGSIFDILSRAFRMVHTLLANMPENGESVSEAHDLQALRKMMGHIQMHYRERILVSDISRAGNVGKSTCHALFRRYLGISPMKYLLDYRLEKATRLLNTTNASISDVAEITGFASSSYFAECFRAEYAISPTAYRRRDRN